MFKHLLLLRNLAEKHIYLSTALFNLIISIWLFANNDIISRDSILYIKVSQAFLDGGIGAAFNVWAWPFYSISFAIIAKITGLDLEAAAHLLTILFEVTISVSFVKIYSRIAFEGARIWVAALFILSFVTLNDYKGDIIREYGFWAFSLIALYQFIVFYQTKTKMSAVLWQVAIFLATLFRPEAIVYAVLAPFFYFLTRLTWMEKLRCILTLNSIFYSLGLIAVITLAVSSQLQQIIINNLPPQMDYFSVQKVFANFNLAADNFVKHVLPFHYSAEYSHLILASGLLTMLVVKLLGNFSVVYSGIWVTGIYKHWIHNKPEMRIIYYFMAIALLILVVFITSRLFVSTRYTVLLLLLAGLLFCQYLDYLLTFLQKQPKKIGLVLLIAFIGVQFLDGMISTGAKKTAMKNAAEYTLDVINEGEKIACNESRLVFYSNDLCELRPGLKEQYSVEESQIIRNNYQYLLVWVKYKNQTMLDTLGHDKNLQLVKEFVNRKDDKALLFKIIRTN